MSGLARLEAGLFASTSETSFRTTEKTRDDTSWLLDSLTPAKVAVAYGSF